MSRSVDSEVMRITPLGAGQEVGRSCILLQFKGRNVMLDCGCHPGREGSDSLPFFDSIDCEIDLILITHFHIDHCAALPYFTERTPFKGRIFMTHATKAVMKLLLADNIRLNNADSRPLYTDQELSNCISKVETIDFHQTIDVQGVKFTATAAGHVLGAAMFTIVIDGKRILYTGDYSLKQDRHLHSAEIPMGDPPHVMIVESTFGITNLPDREERESKFVSTVETIVRRGGSCLIPVFALGRAQELLLILDEFWQTNPDLQTVPVFYASKLAAKALRVYQTFVNMMNDHIKQMMDIANPFKLNQVRNMMKSDFDAMGACVVMASPGFLQNGVSRHLFERWCDDERNGVIIAGYTVEGTLAHKLLSQPTEVTCSNNVIKSRRCQIEYISFSAHVDYSENLSFIKSVQPDNIVLVHGEKTGMKRLKEELEREIRKNWPGSHKPPIAMPENGTVTKIRFPKSVVAACEGAVSSALLEGLEEDVEGAKGKGTSIQLPENTVLVSENFVSKIMTVDELPRFSSVRRGKIRQRLLVPVSIDGVFQPPNDTQDAILGALLPYIQDVFDTTTLDGSRETAHINLENMVSISVQGLAGRQRGEPTLIAVEWVASSAADMAADCAVGIITQTFSAPSLLRRSVFAGGSMTDPVRIGPERRSTTQPSSLNSEPIKEENEDTTGESLVVKKMKTGDIDPSKAIPADAVSIVLSGAGKTKKASKDKNVTRLTHLKDQLSESKTLQDVVTDIQVSADDMKLIFRGNQSEEAYLFVLFGATEKAGHHAVVKSENDAFRSAILEAIANL